MVEALKEKAMEGNFSNRAIVEKTYDLALSNALFIVTKASDEFRKDAPEFRKTELSKLILDIQNNPEKYDGRIAVRFGEQKSDGKEASIYSVKAEIDGKQKIITLRVGDSFTELSLMKNGKLVEVVSEEKKAIKIEKLA